MPVSVSILESSSTGPVYILLSVMRRRLIMSCLTKTCKTGITVATILWRGKFFLNMLIIRVLRHRRTHQSCVIYNSCISKDNHGLSTLDLSVYILSPLIYDRAIPAHNRCIFNTNHTCNIHQIGCVRRQDQVKVFTILLFLVLTYWIRCAFVNFKDRSSAEYAAQAWASGLDVDGERVGVRWGRSRPGGAKGKAPESVPVVAAPA